MDEVAADEIALAEARATDEVAAAILDVDAVLAVRNGVRAGRVHADKISEHGIGVAEINPDAIAGVKQGRLAVAGN